MYSKRCGSYKMYLEGDSPHQAVMIMCELKWFSYISENKKQKDQKCFKYDCKHVF